MRTNAICKPACGSGHFNRNRGRRSREGFLLVCVLPVSAGKLIYLDTPVLDRLWLGGHFYVMLGGEGLGVNF